MLGEPALNHLHSYRSLSRERFVRLRSAHRQRVAHGDLRSSQSDMSKFEPDRGCVPIRVRLESHRRKEHRIAHNHWCRDLGRITMRMALIRAGSAGRYRAT